MDKGRKMRRWKVALESKALIYQRFRAIQQHGEGGIKRALRAMLLGFALRRQEDAPPSSTKKLPSSVAFSDDVTKIASLFPLHHRRKILPYRSIFRVVSRKKSRFFCRRQRFDFFHPRQRFGFPLAVPRITSHLHARDSDRCASLASLLPPQAAFGSAARAGTGAYSRFPRPAGS